MTDDDEPRFRACYHRLCAAQQRKRDINEYDVYLEALKPLPIEAIEAAILELARKPTVPGKTFFPRTTEIFERAARYVDQLHELELADAQRLLPAHANQIADEMPGLLAAREAAIAELMENGDGKGAALLYHLPVRHPLEWDRHIAGSYPIRPRDLAVSATSRDFAKRRKGELVLVGQREGV